MEDMETLLQKLQQYCDQPYTPRSIAEAADWSFESGQPVISHEEAALIKQKLNALRSAAEIPMKISA